MRSSLMMFALVLGLGGCVSDAPSPASAPTITTNVQPPPAMPFLGLNRLPAPRMAQQLDRGRLLDYARSRAPLTRGGETLYAVDLSEAHARAAAAPGRVLNLTTPTGELLRIAYERSEPMQDGNWSWVGKTEEGLTTLLTFGEKAVFGRIEQIGKPPLRILTEAGRTWMVETDPAKQPRMHLEESDALVPTPEMMAATRRASALSAPAPSAAVGAEEVSAKAQTPFNTVDLLLGYSNGLVTQLGGDSQARTRAVFLVAVVNQALAAGFVNYRVRLVHSMAVNYPEQPTHANTAYYLAGWDCSSGTCVQIQQIPPGLQAMRTARETYGADVVALLRTYSPATDVWCGRGFQPSASIPLSQNSHYWSSYAYSSVSVTGSCDDTILAHELGHNFGQTHDVANTSPDAAPEHAYAYGYREAALSGFATVMAYPLSQNGVGQQWAAIFGNPNATYLGRPAGTATEDNARSLNQLMPIVANYRNIVVPMLQAAPNDFNGDNRSDILWRYLPQDYLATWFMNGPAISDFWYTLNGAPSSYAILGSGDFDGDGLTDLLWKGPANDLWLWVRTPDSFVGAFVGYAPAGWSMIGVGDVTWDGKADLLWRYDSSGQVAYWRMNRETIVTGGLVTPNAAGYRFVGALDLNGDFSTELVWSNDTTRQLHVWTPFATRQATTDFTSTMAHSYTSDRTPIGGGDFTGDGRADIYFRLHTTNMFAYLAMNGTSIIGAATLPNTLPANYRYIAAGDYNGDGRGDLLWDNSGTEVLMWLRTASGVSPQKVADTPAGWVTVF
jgi:hypothetical protein